ncbi:hypothetical protein KBD45_08115 [Candidatus Dojkabacteria bacterium]|nr:hypothetical protein [Candidatus Dojkabacteria bacterium]
MNFQSPQMLIIFGTILAVSVISLVVLLLVRNKKMKNSMQPTTAAMDNSMGQPTTATTNAPQLASTDPMTATNPLNNTMQFTANPFETNNLDLNSQNLGSNLAATAGIPNEGIMQNPNTAPHMEIATPIGLSNTPPASDIPSINPMANFGSAAMETPTPVVTEIVQTAPPVMNIPVPVVNNTIPAPTITNEVPNTINFENPIVTPVIPQTPVATTGLQVNGINGSGLDDTAQPINPITPTVDENDSVDNTSQPIKPNLSETPAVNNAVNGLDPAGIFSQTSSDKEIVNAQSQSEASPAQNVTSDELETKISDLQNTTPQQANATIPEPAPAMTADLNANSVADLTPENNLNTVSTPNIQLPDISEINTNPIIPTAQPVIAEVPPTMQTVPTVTPVETTVANPVATTQLPTLPNLVNPPIVNQPTIPTQTLNMPNIAPTMPSMQQPVMNTTTTATTNTLPDLHTQAPQAMGTQTLPTITPPPVPMNQGFNPAQSITQ